MRRLITTFISITFVATISNPVRAEDLDGKESSQASSTNEIFKPSIQLDNGIGISPRNFFGVGVGLGLTDLVKLDLGMSLVGARVAVLGPAYTIGARIGHGFYGALGTTFYRGSGRIPIAFEKTYKDANDPKDSNIDSCWGDSCNDPIVGQRQAEWTITYYNVGMGWHIGGQRVRWLLEFGRSGIASYSVHVDEASDDHLYGGVKGPEVSRSMFGAGVVSKNDGGLYARIMMEIPLH